MITHEEMETALAYLAQQPHPRVECEWRLAIARIERERLFAKLFLAASGKTVDDRKSFVEMNLDYHDAKLNEASRAKELAQHKQYEHYVETLSRLYQTQKADERTQDRITR